MLAWWPAIRSAPWTDGNFTGRNRAGNVNTGSLSGTPTLTRVALIACRQDGPEGGGPGRRTAVEYPMDPGRADISYGSHAGPVTVHGAGHRVMVTGITYDTDGTRADHRRPVFHS
ncbi:hypothetical protein AB0K43_13120 [Kitasatospora sp. NPDC049258]|uniref:hypothetical protein n=1 Tax=Kitasatospora sp. NPDC049258 TaxID=3155394 RepID=UPI00343C8909